MFCVCCHFEYVGELGSRLYDEYSRTYTCDNQIGNKVPTTFLILVRLCDPDFEVRMFVKYLLYSTLISTPLLLNSLWACASMILVIFHIAEVLWV